MPVLDVSLESIVGLRSGDNECADFDEDCYDIAAKGECLSCWLMDVGTEVCPFLGVK